MTAMSDVSATAQIAQSVPSQPLPISGATAPNPPDLQVSADGHEMRMTVTPGEIVQLPPPFDSTSGLEAKTGDGNLALRAGDTTIILQGYVDANEQAPVVVETSHGRPIDIAVVLAQTDPNLDIETAAGPAAGPQEAANGHSFAQFGPFAGLGGFGAVGPLDPTALSYRLIDASIRLALNPEEQNSNDNNGPGPAIGNSQAQVDESALPIGSNPPSNAETTGGTLHVEAPNGTKSITIDGTTVDLTDPSKTGPIVGDHGTLTVTGWNPATGDLDYSYTLKDPFHHDPLQGPNTATGEDFTVVVTDKSGQSGSGDIGIVIVDDVPAVKADTAVVCDCGNASGNVLSNDVPGADGIVAIVAIKDGTHTYTVDDTGKLTSNDDAANYSYDAATGVLHIEHTSGGGSLDIDLSGANAGDFSYHQGKATGADDIQYTVIDGDGDKASTDLHIQPDLSPPVAHDDHVYTLGAGFSVAESWLLANDLPDRNVEITKVENPQGLALTDLGWGEQIVLDAGKTDGSFDYTITRSNGQSDSATAHVTLVTDPGHAIDQSVNSHDVILMGDGYDNTLTGGSGDDVLAGGGGKDVLIGNAGNDRFLYSSQDSFDGGSGTDRLSFADAGTVGFDHGLTDRVHDIEVLDFRNGGADTAGSGKGEALSLDAVLDMTGGKGELWIAAEDVDSVTLDKGFTKGSEMTNTTVGDGIPDGTYFSYTASDGVHSATVHIDVAAQVHTA
jgi:Ca2+-binding RTX toxin-like protein